MEITQDYAGEFGVWLVKRLAEHGLATRCEADNDKYCVLTASCTLEQCRGCLKGG